MVAAGFVTSMWARNESSIGVFFFFSFEFFPGSVDSFFSFWTLDFQYVALVWRKLIFCWSYSKLGSLYSISVWHWYFCLAGLFPCKVKSCSPLPISQSALWGGGHSRRHWKLKSELLHSCCKSLAWWPDSCSDRVPRGGRRAVPASLTWSWSRPPQTQLCCSGWLRMEESGFPHICKSLGFWIFLISFLPFLPW